MKHCLRIGVVGGIVLLAAIVMGSGQTRAAFAVCRTDPIVTLSNGHTVTLAAEISADPSQVTSVQYVLHVPHDLTATNIAYDQYGYLESVTIVQDQNGNRFAVDTIVTTTVSAEVTAYASLSTKDKAGEAHGKNGDKLRIDFG